MQFIIRENVPIAQAVYRMRLAGDTARIARPGQFVQVQVPGFYLRRPISVCDWDAETLTLVYKTVGHGTEAMAALAPGATLDLLTGLGNGFDVDLPAAAAAERPLLVGGGVGTPPLVGLCRALLAKGRQPAVALGFGTAADVIGVAAFAAMGVAALVSTLDGSAGVRGYVTDAIAQSGQAYDYLYACGPEPMLRAAYALPMDGQFSFESRMACGFGACMGCTCHTTRGPKRICKDGPVLQKEEIVW